MSQSALPVMKRPFLRFWLPVIWIVLSVAGIGLIWLWPAPDWERFQRVFSTMGVILLTLLGLGLWFLFFSGLRWRTRLATLVVVVLLAGPGSWAAVEEVEFSGDFVPIFHFRWAKSKEALLEAKRQREKADVEPPPIILLGIKPEDYPEYRGRNRDGKVVGPALNLDWKNHPPLMLWRQPVGGGYSSFAIVGNLAVTLEQRGKQEALVGYDTATGHERWLYSYPAEFKEFMGGKGPRATPTIAGKEVYSLGAMGMLVCLDAATGKYKWSVNILENNDNVRWGMSGSPLVVDEMVVVNPGVQRSSVSGKALVAYNRLTGKEVWSQGNAQAGYAAPMLATLTGQRQILIFDGEGLAGHDPANGHELWRFPWKTPNGINVAQPVVLPGDRIFVSSNYGIGCAMLQVKIDEPAKGNGRRQVVQLWHNHALRCRFSNPVEYQGFIYGLDEGVLVCLDGQTGNRRWRGSRFGHGQLLLTDELLVILSESGELALVSANPDAYRELASIPALRGDKTWNYPALANGIAYVRNHEEMACFDLTPMTKGKKKSR